MMYFIRYYIYSSHTDQFRHETGRWAASFLDATAYFSAEEARAVADQLTGYCEVLKVKIGYEPLGLVIY